MDFESALRFLAIKVEPLSTLTIAPDPAVSVPSELNDDFLVSLSSEEPTFRVPSTETSPTVSKEPPLVSFSSVPFPTSTEYAGLLTL